MADDELEVLKKMFSYSSENVFILDYDLEILWYNKDELINFFGGISFRELLGYKTGVIESGEYTFMYSGLEFSCTLINYREKKLYVLQLDGDDALYSCMKSDAVRGFLANQAAKVRQAVAGISIAETMIRKTLDNAGIRETEKYLDITSGSCYKLLKSVLNTAELMKYTDEIIKPKKISLTEVLEEFAGICCKILKGQVEIRVSSCADLFISSDYERLTSCLLSLALLSSKQNPDCSVINFCADRTADTVTLTVSASEEGRREQNKMFSEQESVSENDISDSDLFVVYRFCRTFSGTLLVTEIPENRRKIYSVKLPYCNDEDEIPDFHSPSSSYYEDRFSKYHIALSDIADIY